MAGARVVSCHSPRNVQQAAFTSLCRDVNLQGFQWPMTEDLLLGKDILWFSHWCRYQDDAWDGLPAFPCLRPLCTHFAVGDQPGAGAASKATPLHFAAGWLKA